MNKVFLIGNLTRDPELTETASGIPVCHFSIAVNRSYENSEGERLADFFNCSCWRELAQSVARYTKKGKKVAVVGSIQLRNYEDNQGVKRVAVDVIVESVEFLSPAERIAPPEVEEPVRGSKKKDGEEKPKLTPMNDDSDIPF